jgi:hypothetical protein
LQDPSKFTLIGIFGFKICHLATLFETVSGISSHDLLHDTFDALDIV